MRIIIEGKFGEGSMTITAALKKILGSNNEIVVKGDNADGVDKKVRDVSMLAGKKITIELKQLPRTAK